MRGSCVVMGLVLAFRRITVVARDTVFTEWMKRSGARENKEKIGGCTAASSDDERCNSEYFLYT